MKTLKIARLEGIYAICQDKDGKFFAIQTGELPQGAAAGDLLDVDDEAGTLAVQKASKEKA